MPEIVLEIGGRSFTLACDSGEEASLKMAAEMLAVEARRLEDAIGRVPESRMLLMAGLMLADRTKDMETACQLSDTRLKTLEDRLLESEAKLAEMTVVMNKQPEPAEEDLFNNSEEVSASFAKSVARIEAMIDTSA
ncbi:MAG TPA: cell division protein ZapA [Rhodobacteraceae bacterium]|nr:cell division protein ZapA [Paracoccaceae bacterium]